jgi:hypothetical protein
MKIPLVRFHTWDYSDLVIIDHSNQAFPKVLAVSFSGVLQLYGRRRNLFRNAGRQSGGKKELV